MNDLEKINIVKEEHEKSITDYNRSLEILTKFDADFLTVKLAFTAFIGIIFTIIFQQNNNSKITFGLNFTTLILFILILTFLLLLQDFWLKFKIFNKKIPKEAQRAILDNIKYTVRIMALTEPSDKKRFEEYYKEASRLIREQHEISQAIKQGKSIQEIIKSGSSKSTWLFNFIAWAMLFLSIPILFLFKLLNLL